MSEARIYARNLAANWIGHAAHLVVLFFLSPFIVRTLGRTEYGIWSLINILTGYMGVLDLGVRASTGRHIALHLGKGDREAADQTVRTGLFFFSVMGLIVVLAGVVLGLGFPYFFTSVRKEYHTLIACLLPLMALNIWVGCLGSVFSSVLTANQRFDLARGLDLLVLAMRSIGAVFVLTRGYGLTGFAVVVFVSSALAAVGNYLLARRVQPTLRAWPPSAHRARLKEMLGYGMAIFVSRVCVRLTGQTGLVVVGAVITVAEVTTYSVGAMIVFYTGSFILRIRQTFFPAVQQAVARGDLESARWLFLRQVRLAMVAGIPAYVGFIVFGREFVHLWMFHPVEFPEASVVGAAGVMAILSLSKALELLRIGSEGLLNSMGYIKLTASLNVAQTVVALSLAVLFPVALGWGILGVAAGNLVGCTLVGAFTMPWCACRKAGMSWRRHLWRIGIPAAMAGALFAGVCLAVKHVMPSRSWGEFFLKVVIALVLYVPVALALLVPAQDRKRLLAMARMGRWVGQGKQA